MLNLLPVNVDIVHGLLRHKVARLIWVKLSALLDDWLRDELGVLQELLKIVEFGHFLLNRLLEVRVAHLVERQMAHHLCHVHICIVVYLVKLIVRIEGVGCERGPFLEQVIVVFVFGKLAWLMMRSLWSKCFRASATQETRLFILNHEIDDLLIKVSEAKGFILDILFLFLQVGDCHRCWYGLRIDLIDMYIYLLLDLGQVAQLSLSVVESLRGLA